MAFAEAANALIEFFVGHAVPRHALLEIGGLERERVFRWAADRTDSAGASVSPCWLAQLSQFGARW